MSKKARANESDPSSEQNLISSHKLLLIFNLYRSQEEAPNSNNGNGSRGGWSPPLTWWLLHPILNSIIPEASAGNIGISSSNLENLCAYRLSKIIPNTPGQLHTHTNPGAKVCLRPVKRERVFVGLWRSDSSLSLHGRMPPQGLFVLELLPADRCLLLCCSHICVSPGSPAFVRNRGKHLHAPHTGVASLAGNGKKSPGALNVNVVSWVKAGALA